MKKQRVKHQIPLCLALTALLFSFGCSTINVSEALQVPEGTKLYTAYNIWKPGRWKISSINYQRGKLFPFGTEVKILHASNKEVKLKVVSNGTILRIRYHEEYGMEPMTEYLKRLVTTKNRNELAKGIKPEILALILNGKVAKGMTKHEVTLTCGPPSPHRTPSLEEMTWIYWYSRWNTYRIIFRNGKVIEII